MLRSIVNVNPIAEARAIEDMFERMFGTPSRPTNTTQALPVDITEKEGKLFVRAAVPGVEPNELDISIENNVLTIRGEHKQETENQDEKVYRREVSYGTFSRSIRLPEELDLNAVDAEFKNGFVTITLPRLPEQKPQSLKVPVRTAEQATPTEQNTAQ